MHKEKGREKEGPEKWLKEKMNVKNKGRRRN